MSDRNPRGKLLELQAVSQIQAPVRTLGHGAAPERPSTPGHEYCRPRQPVLQ